MDFLLHHHDLTIAKGDLAICATDTEAIAQTIAVRLKTLEGEWFLDTTIGIPYLSEILGHKRSDRLLRTCVTQEILAVAGVKELTDFSFDHDRDSRSVTIKFTAVLSSNTTITINESMEI
jgi:hypothetical protein